VRRTLSTIIVSLFIGAVRLVHGHSAQELTPSSDGHRISPAASDSKALEMTRAIVCRSIDGFEKYEPLPGAALTQDEKLLIYYRPLNYKTVREGQEYQVHLTQDGQIRREGEKAVLRRKKNILDYQPKSTQLPGVISLKNSVSLKGLQPGNYEYDIILRDENNPGTLATQSLKFRVVRAELPKPEKE
jgi:hypothetical protein